MANKQLCSAVIATALAFGLAACGTTSPKDTPTRDASSSPTTSGPASTTAFEPKGASPWEDFCRADIPDSWQPLIEANQESIDPSRGAMLWTNGTDSIYEPIGSMTGSGEDRSAYWINGAGESTTLISLDGYDTVRHIAVEANKVAFSYSLGNTGSPIFPMALTLWDSESGQKISDIIPRTKGQVLGDSNSYDNLMWYGTSLWHARFYAENTATVVLARYDTSSGEDIRVADGVSDIMALWNGTIVAVTKNKTLRQFDAATGDELSLDPRLASFTGVDKVTAEGENLIFQTASGDDTTNQYWAISGDDDPHKLLSSDDDAQLLAKWRDFSATSDGFVVARGNDANIVIDLRTHKWAAVPLASDSWPGYMRFIDQNEGQWTWQAAVPTAELPRLEGCATRPAEHP